jgi:hypothetical protein
MWVIAQVPHQEEVGSSVCLCGEKATKIRCLVVF